MRVCVLWPAGIALIALMIACLGCSEEKLIPEDLSVLDEEMEKPVEKGEEPPESPPDRAMWDPDRRRKVQEEEEKRKEAEEREKEARTAEEKAVWAMDKMGELINEMKFDEALKVFDENKGYIEKVVEEKIPECDPESAKLWGQWTEKMYKIREILINPELDQEKKKSRAFSALSAAGLSRRAAKQREIFER